MEIHIPTANPFPPAPTLPTTSSIHHHCVCKKEMTATCSLQPFQTCRNHNQNRYKANLKRLEFYRQRTITVTSSLINRISAHQFIPKLSMAVPKSQ